MYVEPNFPTKKALREAIAAGAVVTTFAPGLGTPKDNGVEFVEGPHYPAPHTWYAQVVMVDGRVTKVK
jgi:hypothetical protein